MRRIYLIVFAASGSLIAAPIAEIRIFFAELKVAPALMRN